MNSKLEKDSDSVPSSGQIGLEDSKGKLHSGTVLQLFARILKYRRITVEAGLMIFLGTFAALLEPRLFGYAIDEAIVSKRQDLLEWIGAAFIGATCLRIYAAKRQAYLFELLGQRVAQDLRVELFSHLQRLPVAIFDRVPSGRLLTRVTNDIGSLNEMFSAGFVSIVSNGLLVLGILIWMLVLDVKLGLIAASVFPILAWLSVYFSRQLREAYGEVRSRLSALNVFLAENFSGMKTVHLFNQQIPQLRKFDELNQKYSDAQIGSIRVFAYFQPMITLGAGVSIALLIWFGGKETVSGHLKVGVLVAYFSYVLSLFQPLREIADKWNVFLSGMTSAERVFTVLNLPTELKKEEVLHKTQPIPEIQGNIKFENVWFSYRSDREGDWVIRDLSFEIRAGEKIGIVGHTGAGKSTLIGLLLRFYEPKKGRITLDGRDLREYDKRSLRASFGLVQQDVFLFSGTFEENITFWDSSKKQEVEHVLKELRLPIRNLDLEMNERGSNLSMGERQVLAFARAAASKPRIWILDEATSSMDSEQEKVLQKSLTQISGGRTGIYVAHRLATIRETDRILVLHKGLLVEQGNHGDLIKRNGLYSRLYRYQGSQPSPLCP
ncbi:MAG: ABC transporter ATP-binding protein [Bdellovibrio sp.]|nr:ABC transporter ATP-binding protein [Bdellovibrio sp.]